MDAKRKELKFQYVERKKIGGIYSVRNTVNNKLLVEFSPDLQGSKNRFDFSCSTDSCVFMKMQKDWSAQKGEGFTFEVLEELEKGDIQTDKEFREDLEALKEMWLEKLVGESLY